MVSTGYFRKYGNFLYYYSSINPTYDRSFEVARGLRFKLSELSAAQVKKPELLDDESLRKTTSDFSDPLAEEILVPSPVIASVQKLFLIPVQVAQSLDTWLDYFIVVSMGFALMLLYSLRKIANWKLIDAMLIILLSIGIFTANSMYYSQTKFIFDFSARVQGFLPFSVPVVFCMNIALILIFAIIGFIQLFRRSGEQK